MVFLTMGCVTPWDQARIDQAEMHEAQVAQERQRRQPPPPSTADVCRQRFFARASGGVLNYLALAEETREMMADPAIKALAAKDLEEARRLDVLAARVVAAFRDMISNCVYADMARDALVSRQMAMMGSNPVAQSAAMSQPEDPARLEALAEGAFEQWKDAVFQLAKAYRRMRPK